MKHCILCLAASLFHLGTFADDLRIGIIGCDTSHAIAFTETLNSPSAPGHVAGGRVVAAYKGGSEDIPSSRSRVDQYSSTLKEKYGVRFYDTIEEMCWDIDAVLLESVDGRPHLDQVRPVLKARKPVFIDKPMAGSLHDVIEIFQLAKKAKVPVFSSSSLRFATNTQAVSHGAVGKVMYVETYGPCELESHHPDLFWYGIHGVEALYTMMGTGCKTVQRATNSEGRIEVIGSWPGGRTGIFREDKDFHGQARGSRGTAAAGSFDGYVPLVAEIMKFYQTRVAPITPEETIEIFAFMEAADVSKSRGGAPVKVRELLRKNRK
jgi:hypothetical protein